MEQNDNGRCDRCGVRTKFVVTLPSGGELQFCLHHWREHHAALDGCPVFDVEAAQAIRVAVAGVA